MRASWIAASLVLALAGSARADDLDRFLEAREANDWAAAERAFQGLAAAASEPLSTGLVLRHADVLVHLGQRKAARSAAEAVLEREPRNVVALALLARLTVGEHEAAAKELLLQAAREGYYVIREVRETSELRPLLEQPSFVLDVLKAPTQAGPAPGEQWRNPFAVPRADRAAGAAEEKKPPVGPARADRRDPHQKLEDLIRDGNEHLRAMVALLREEKYAEVSNRFAEVKALCDEARKEPEEEFSLNARAILARAGRLDDEARRLRHVRELHIVVTGIVVTATERSRAIVALGDAAGEIYEEGDELRNATGARVHGLKVARIVEGSVSFTFDDVPFVRELRRAP
jgi:hypothetical protein